MHEKMTHEMHDKASEIKGLCASYDSESEMGKMTKKK